MQTFAGFEFSLAEEIIIGFLIVSYIAFIVTFGVFILALVLEIVSRKTKKDIRLGTLLKNRKVRMGIRITIISISTIIVLMLGYYGLIDN